MRKLVPCLILVMALASCKKSVEGESKRWQRANGAVDKLVVLYPGFEAALEEQRGKAKTAMDAAKQVDDESARIKAMSRANALLTTGFVDQLSAVDATSKRVRGKLVDLAGAKADEDRRRGAHQAAAEARRILAAVDDRLKRGAATAKDAAVVLERVTEDLRVAESTVDRVAKAARDDQAARAAAAAKAKADADEAKAKAKAAETWTCEYCSTENKAALATCGNCGAAVPHRHE